MSQMMKIDIAPSKTGGAPENEGNLLPGKGVQSGNGGITLPAQSGNGAHGNNGNTLSRTAGNDLPDEGDKALPDREDKSPFDKGGATAPGKAEKADKPDKADKVGSQQGKRGGAGAYSGAGALPDNNVNVMHGNGVALSGLPCPDDDDCSAEYLQAASASDQNYDIAWAEEYAGINSRFVPSGAEKAAYVSRGHEKTRPGEGEPADKASPAGADDYENSGSAQTGGSGNAAPHTADGIENPQVGPTYYSDEEAALAGQRENEKSAREGMVATGWDNVSETPRSAAVGVINALNQAISTVYELGDSTSHLVPDWMNYRLTFDRDENGEFVVGIDKTQYNTENPSTPPQIPNFDAPETPMGEAVSAVTQFLTGFATGGKALKGIKAISTGGRVAKAALQSAVADFAFMDPLNTRVSDLIQAVPALANPVNEFLASNPNDTRMEARLKNAIEGLGLGVLAEGLFVSLNAIRKAYWFRNTFGSSNEAMQALVDDMLHMADAQEAKGFIEGMADAGAPLVREAQPKQLNAGFKLTQNETGITGLSKADWDIMHSSDWMVAKNEGKAAAARVVDKIWGEEQTKKLATKLGSDKQTVFVPVPSTSGTNELPNALGKKLARELSAEYLERVGLRSRAQEQMKTLKRADRPFAFRDYALVDPVALDKLKGKQVVVVEDVFTTGSSVKQFVLALRQHGVDVHSVAGLMGNANLDVPPNLVRGLKRELQNAGIGLKAQELANVLSSGEVEAISNIINKAGSTDAREEITRKLQRLLHQRTAGVMDGNPRQYSEGQPKIHSGNGWRNEGVAGGLPLGLGTLEGRGGGEDGSSGGQEASGSLWDIPGTWSGREWQLAGGRGLEHNEENQSGLPASTQLIGRLQETLQNAEIALQAEEISKVFSSGEIESVIDSIEKAGGTNAREEITRKLRGLLHQRTAGTVGGNLGQYSQGQPKVYPRNGGRNAWAAVGVPLGAGGMEGWRGGEGGYFGGQEASGALWDRPGPHGGRGGQLAAATGGRGIAQGEINFANAPASPQLTTGEEISHPEINFARINGPEDVRLALQQLAGRHQIGLDAEGFGEQTLKTAVLSAEQESAWQYLVKRRQGQPLAGGELAAARGLWATATNKLSSLARAAAYNPTTAHLFAFRKMLSAQNTIQQEVLASTAGAVKPHAAWLVNSGAAGDASRHMGGIVNAFGGKKANRELARRVAGLAGAGMFAELSAVVEKSLNARSLDDIEEAWATGLLSGPQTDLAGAMGGAFAAIRQSLDTGGAAGTGLALGSDAAIGLSEATAQLEGMLGGLKDGFRLAAKSLRAANGGGASAGGADAEGAWAGINHARGAGVNSVTHAGHGAGTTARQAPANKTQAQSAPSFNAESLRIAKSTALGKSVDVIGKAAGASGGFAAEEELFKTVGYRAELHAQAFRQASREAEAGIIAQADIKERMAQLLANPPQNIRYGAADHSAYLDFADAPGKFAENWQRAARQNPNLKFITPFVQTPENILNCPAGERGPLAPLFRDLKADFEAGGARRDLAAARASTGAGVMLAGMDLAFGGTLTGDGPADPAERKELMRAGWRPGSVKVGGKYYAYDRNSPVGLTLRIAANLAEIAAHLDPEDREADIDEAAICFGASLAGAAMSKSYMRGLAEFFEALAEPQGREAALAGSFAGDSADNAAPEMTEIADGPVGKPKAPKAGGGRRKIDPYLLRVNAMVEEMREKIPGLAKALPARRDLWGRRAGYKGGLNALYDAISPIAGRRENPEPVDAEMLRLGCSVAAPRRTASFGGVSIDLARFGDACSRYAELAGNGVKSGANKKGCLDFLNAVVTGKHQLSAIYERQSDSGKAHFIRAAVKEHRELAKKQLLREYPEIRREIEAKRAVQAGWKLPQPA